VRAVRQVGFKGPVFSDSPLDPQVIKATSGEQAADAVFCNGMDQASPTPEMLTVDLLANDDVRAAHFGDRPPGGSAGAPGSGSGSGSGDGDGDGDATAGDAVAATTTLGAAVRAFESNRPRKPSSSQAPVRR